MKLSKININPKSLAFVTTDKCTASCHNCCFKCNPKNNKRLKLEEILSIIDQVVEDFPSVESCVFTGGECTLLKGDLAIAIEHASKKKLSCRIVSNGFWATNEKVAHSFLAKLHNKGLSELNLSTGDEHQKWIPYKNIINACKAALKENILVAINVESTSNSHFTSQNLLEDPEIKEAIYKNKIILKDSLWIEFDKTNSSEQAYIPDKKGCSYLFNTISISPDMHFIQLNSLVKNEEEQKLFKAIALEINGESLSTRSVAIYGIVTVLIAIAIVVTITVGFSNREDASTLSNELKDSVCNNTTNVLKINNPEHMIINMWALNHDIDSYQVVSGYKRFLTKQVIVHLKETNSPVLAKYSEKQISEFLKGNMLV